MEKFEELSSIIGELDSYLSNTFTYVDESLAKIYESMKYSLFSGGKRIRPLLAIITYNELCEDPKLDKILPFAAALEMIHTYSLIHDDLPSMDNDDIRRDKPTNHKVYSEAIAILAGDGLLNMSMEVLAKYMESLEDMDELKKCLKATKFIYNSSGVLGMVGGQLLDIDNNVEKFNQEICEDMYSLKTAALLKASIITGAIIAGSDSEVISKLKEFGQCIGLAYQYKDDLLDMDKDSKNCKNTMLKFKSKDEIEDDIEALTKQGIEAIANINFKDEILKEFCIELIKRDF